jgi:hypothetical protein
MKQLSQIINGCTWQLLKKDTSSASHITLHMVDSYNDMLKNKVTTSLVNAYNSMHNLHANEALTIGELCTWVERQYMHTKRITQKDLLFVAYKLVTQE